MYRAPDWMVFFRTMLLGLSAWCSEDVDKLSLEITWIITYLSLPEFHIILSCFFYISQPLSN